MLQRLRPVRLIARLRGEGVGGWGGTHVRERGSRGFRSLSGRPTARLTAQANIRNDARKKNKQNKSKKRLPFQMNQIPSAVVE